MVYVALIILILTLGIGIKCPGCCTKKPGIQTVVYYFAYSMPMTSGDVQFFQHYTVH